MRLGGDQARLCGSRETGDPRGGLPCPSFHPLQAFDEHEVPGRQGRDPGGAHPWWGPAPLPRETRPPKTRSSVGPVLPLPSVPPMGWAQSLPKACA